MHGCFPTRFLSVVMLALGLTTAALAVEAPARTTSLQPTAPSGASPLGAAGMGGAPAAPVARAGDLASAQAAYQGGKFQQALELLLPLETDDAVAAGMSCELFVRGLVQPDDGRGGAACEHAAKSGDPRGLYWRGLAGQGTHPTLGLMVTEVASLGYLAQAAEKDYGPALGRLCTHFYETQSFRDAVAVCAHAASRGIPEGLHYYGLMALEGKGVAQDFRKGVDGLLLALQSRYAPAAVKMAELSRDGSAGLKKSPTKAYAWILLASSLDPDSPAIASFKQDLAKTLDESKMAAAQKAAAAWPLAAPGK